MSKGSNIANLRDKIPVIEEALRCFLTEHDLSLTQQNFDRARDHLLPCLNDYKDLSVEDVSDYIKELVEYNEFVIDGMNRSGISEDSLVHILVSADQRPSLGNGRARAANSNWKFNLSQIPLPIAVTLFLLVGFAVATPLSMQRSDGHTQAPLEMSREIGISAIGELKALVDKVVEAEGRRGNEISSAKIWNKVKSAPELVKYGYSSSYKSFNQGQYLEAKKMLVIWARDGFS